MSIDPSVPNGRSRGGPGGGGEARNWPSHILATPAGRGGCFWVHFSSKGAKGSIVLAFFDVFARCPQTHVFLIGPKSIESIFKSPWIVLRREKALWPAVPWGPRWLDGPRQAANIEDLRGINMKFCSADPNTPWAECLSNSSYNICLCLDLGLLGRAPPGPLSWFGLAGLTWVA